VNNHFLQPAGYVYVHTAQQAVSLPCWKGTLMTCVQLAREDPKIPVTPFLQAAEMSLKSSPALQCINQSPPIHCHTQAGYRYNPLLLWVVINEDVK